MRIFKWKSKQTTPLIDCGFYINNNNQDTFLYQSMKKNSNSFSDKIFYQLQEKNNYKKWLYPLFCDISLFDNYERTVAPHRKIIEKNKGNYFFDMSIEAIPYYPNDCYMSEKFKSFHAMLERKSIDPEKIFFVNANLVADQYYENWIKNNNIRYPIKNKILTHQYSLGGFSNSFNMYFAHNNLLQRNIELIEESMRNNIQRKYYFTALMLRPRFQRTVIALHLLERNLLSQGIVSYHGEELGYKDAPTVEQAQQTYNLIANMQSGKRLTSAWDQLMKISPITVDSTLEIIKEQGWAPKNLGFFPRPIIENTDSIKNRSYFEIVTETYFTDESCLYITEKTLWAILSFQPFIMVGSPFTLRYLQSLGFKTFAPYIDESYDLIANPQQRLEKIMQEIDRLCNMPIHQLHQMYNELWSILLHNNQHYLQNSKQLAQQQIQLRILNHLQ